MLIIGIDPGTIHTGFGIVKFKNNELSYVTSGIINIPPSEEIAPKLENIYDNIDTIIKKYKPDEFAIETSFYGKNVQSAMKISYARSVSILAAIHNGLNIKEYSPREIKKSVVGNGSANKEQVQYMIKKLLNLRSDKIKFDESDAIAAAICHAFRANSFSSKSSNWKEYVKANPDKIIE